MDTARSRDHIYYDGFVNINTHVLYIFGEIPLDKLNWITAKQLTERTESNSPAF